MVHKPILTFVVAAFEQEDYVAEAVEAAFRQTYSPLEIILSDDCSSDQTFEVMQRLAREYKGPHKVVLNRNERNLGLVGHVNRAVELAAGEIIVGSAGD